MAEQLLTGQPTPPTGPLPLTYQNLFTESTKVSQRKDVPLPDGKYAANAKELETFLQTPENVDSYYKMYSAPAMAFGARNLDQFKVKLSGGLTSGEIAMQKAKPSLPTVKPQTQVQQMEYQDLNQPAIEQFNELKANKINKTATGKLLNSYTEMQDYFSSPENISEWGKAYSHTINLREIDLNQIANNVKPKQSLKTVTEIQTTAAEQVQRDDLGQIDPEKLAELVYNVEELGMVGEAIKLEKPIELTELVNGQLITKNITELTYDDYTQLLKKKFGKSDIDTSLIEPSVSGELVKGEPLVYDQTEFGKELNKVKENYLDIKATKVQEENRSKIKNYNQDIETKMRQLLSPEEQQMQQVNAQIEALDDKMLTDKFSGKGIPPDYYAKRNTLEQQLTSMRGKAGLGTARMFDSRTGQFVETTPEQQQIIQIGAQKAQAAITKSTPKEKLKAERNLLWEKVQLLDQQFASVKNEWKNQNIPGSTAIGLAQEALGIEGGMTAKSAQLFNAMLNIENKKAELYGQLLTYNSALATNEDVFQREKESSLKAAGESFLEDTYGFALFTDKNTARTRMQEVEDIKNFYAKNGYELSNKQILSSQESLTTEVASGAGELLNLAIDIGATSGLFKMAAGTLTGSKYWQATKELMSNKFGAYGRFATSMTEGALPYLTQGAAYGALGQNFATGVAENITEKGFDKYAARGIEKFGGKYGKITFILGRWISGTLGEGAAEVMGEISPLLLENGFDVNAAYKQAFGETADEQTKYFAKLGLTVAFMAAPANLGYVFKTKQKIQEHIANNGSNPVLEETMRVLDDTIERMPTGEAATRLDERIYGDNPVEPLVFTEATSTIINEDAIEPPIQGPAERPLETVEVEKRSANNGEEFFVLENDGKVNKNVVYRVNETNGQLEVKGYDAMQEGWVPASKTITDAVDRKLKENGIISSDKASRVAKQRLNINPDAERVITAEGKVLYQTPGQTAVQFGRNRQRNTNTVRATADNTFAFLNGLKEKIITNIFPNAETKIDDQQSASYNKYRDAVRAKMKLNAGSFFSKGKAVLMESGMNKIPKVADFLAALVEDFSKTGKTIEVAASAAANVTTKVGLKIEDVVNSIISTEFFQDKFGSIAEASDYAKNLLTDLMINDKSVAQEIFGQNKEAYNQFIKFREGFNKYVAKNYTGSMNFKTNQNFYNNQMPDVAIKAREEEFQMEEKQRVQEQAKREDVANVLNLAGTETSTENVEGVRYKQGELTAQQYLEMLGEDTNGLTSDEITAKAEVASEGVNLDTFNQAVANRTTNEQTRKKRETRLRKELKTKFGFNNPLAKLIAKGALPDMSMGSKRAVTATMMNKVIETAATRAGVTADEFLDNYLQFQKSTEQEFSDFVKNQPGGKELYQRIGELGAQYNQEVNQFLINAKKFEKEGKTPEEILLATGWSKGADGNWKYTLVAPSSNLNVSTLTGISTNQPKSLPLGAILDYPELYRAYPQLKQYEVIIENNPSSDAHGSFSGEIITINIAKLPTLYQFNMVLQHELQHAVQRIEGWPGGGNPDSVYMANPIDVLEAVAEKLRETGTPISDLAVKEADRLIRESGGQLVGASRSDFEALMDLIQQNLWDSFHPKFNEDLVNEFTQKFDMGTSNQVINLLREVTNDSIYRSLYGEIEAENAVNQDYRAVNRVLNSILIDPDLLEKVAKPGKTETIKDLITQFNKVQSEYKDFVETAKLALAEVANNNSLTRLQKDILNNAFGTTQNNEFGKLDKSKIDSVPFDIVKLYTQLQKDKVFLYSQKDPNIPTEALETILNVIKIRSDYANSSTKLKNAIVSNSTISSATLDSDMLMVETPLFYSKYTNEEVVPVKKYNPEGYKTSQRQWEAKRKQLDDASNAVQDFDPTTLFQSNRGAAFITQDATDLIVALTDPNLSTPLHEIAHIYEKYMTDAEKKIVLDMTGETSWSTNTSEYFARGFERYLYSGNAPTAKMMPLFDKLRTWLKDIYTQLTGSEIDVPLNQQMRDVYSAMLGEAKTPETEVTPANAPQTADAALADFISNKRNQGISDDQIYVGLLQSGFKAADLQDYFNLETRQTVATQIEENGPVKDEARIAADEAAGLYVKRTAEQLEMEMDSLTIEESQAMIENFSNASNLDAAIANKIQDILQKKAEGKDVQKDFEDLIATGTNLGRALQAFTRLKNQSGALRARNLISKLKQEGKKIPDAVKNKLLALGDAYDEAKAKLNNAKVAAENNPSGQSPVAGKSNIQYFQQQLANTQNIGQQFASVARPYMSEASYTSTWGTLIRGNLLTPTSTIINITSNAVKAVFNIPINLISSGVSQLSSLVGGTKGSMRGVDYYKYGWQFGFMTGVKKGVSILKKGNLPDTSQGLQIEPGFNGFRSMTELFGGLMAYAQGKSTADIAAEYGYNLDQSGKIPNKEKAIKTLEGIFGVPAEAFFRLLGSVDAVFRNTAYYSALSEQAKLSGLKDPKDIENFIILNSDYSNKAADNEALRYVYSNNSGAYKFISKIYGSGQGPGGKLWKLSMTGVIPYAKIPTNLAIEYSEIMIPDLAFAKAAIAAGKIFTLNTKIKKTKNPQAKLKLEAQKQELARKRDELIGRGIVGYALTYAGKWFAESGALSAGAQGEDKKRKDYVYRFERPNSINLSLVKRYINGDKNDLWQEGDAIVDYRAAGVFGGILFTSQSERRSTEKEQNKEVANQSVFSSLFDMGYNSNAAETARYLIDQSFVKGLNQALATVDPRQDGAIEKFTSGLMGTLSTAILPNSLAIFDKANRNYIPEYDSPYTGIDKILTDFMAKVKERWPFDDPNNMTAKVDAFGRPIPQTPVGANAWFYNAFDVTKFSRGLYDDKDKSWEQLVYEAVKKGDVLTAFPANPSPIVKSRVGGESYVLSPEDYQKYAIAVGEARRQIVNQFIENADLSQLTDMNSALNQMTPDNQKPYGYVVLGKILTNLYSAADATLINTERGLIYEARKKMATERPEEFKKLIEKEKTNIYSQALDLLYNDPEMSQYIPKTTAQDIFFKKKGTYTEDREYLMETPESQQPATEEKINVMEEFFKQK